MSIDDDLSRQDALEVTALAVDGVRDTPDVALVQVTAPHFTAGLVATNGYVTRAAPILRYMVGWDGRRVRDYAASKGWRWQTVTGTR